MLELVAQNEFDAVFNIMKNSFPSDEYRSYSAQKQLLHEKRYRLYCVKNNGNISAFVAIWVFDSFLFVEHIAVESCMRGKGTGTYILRALSQMYNMPICLEVEPPADDVTCRRINFYRKNGFCLNEYDYVQPAMDVGKNEIPLMIMSSGNLLSENEFDRVKDTLYHFIYKTGEQI